jgi:AraC-like DNA-binding protein
VGFLWVRNFLFAFTAYLVLTGMQQLLGLLSGMGLIRELNYGDAWWYYIVFSFIVYYIAISGYNNSTETKVALKLLQQDAPPKQLGYTQAAARTVNTDQFESIAYEEMDGDIFEANTGQADDNGFLSAAELEAWKEKTERLIVGEALYKNPELTLSILAKKLQTNASFLSKVINNGFGVNFNDFINGFRVREVKTLLADPANLNITIMSLAYEAGFNSKATFNRAFKKLTGENPKDFLAALRSSSLK